MKLSKQQACVLGYIKRHNAFHRYSPSIAEIQVFLGVASTNGVRKHLKKLEVKGAIRIEGARRITVLEVAS